MLIFLLCTEHYLYSVMDETSKKFELLKFAKKGWNFSRYNFDPFWGGYSQSLFYCKTASLILFKALKQFVVFLFDFLCY